MTARIRKDEWIIAYRKKCAGILSCNDNKFKIIPNSLRYWCADPFLLEVENKTFLLFEMFDRLRGKGLIGYRYMNNGAYGKMRVLINEVGHLSYPFIFEIRNGMGGIYVMPESNDLCVIKCFSIFCEGNRLKVVAEHVVKQGKFADTTMLEYDGKKYWFTTDLSKGDNVSDLTIFNEDFSCKLNKKGFFDKSNARMGGNFIVDNDKIIRVSQNCTNGYGTGLNFSNCYIKDGEYVENLIKSVSVDNIKLETKNKYDGIHTYNFNNEYEVIDLKRSKVVNFVRIFGYFLVKIGILKK